MCKNYFFIDLFQKTTFILSIPHVSYCSISSLDPPISINVAKNKAKRQCLLSRIFGFGCIGGFGSL